MIGAVDEGPAGVAADGEEVAALTPMLRRIVAARMGDHTAAEDLVQETVARVLAARDRIEPALLEPYAITTVRNLIASAWRSEGREERNRHRAHDPTEPVLAEDLLVGAEERTAVVEALDRLDREERRLVLAHEVRGLDTRSLADGAGTSPGAVAARLGRARARLRVEYLLALEGAEPPTDRCRPVLLAQSGADRRRQREVGAAEHLLGCAFCARLSGPLLDRGVARSDVVRVAVGGDADIVTARRAARELAAGAGLGGTDLTLLATAVSEVARNIVRFAGSGEVVVDLVGGPRRGVRVTARDAGPGIADVDRAMRDGYSTCRGLGLGLPGARRLVDEFAVSSAVGRGTTVTMTTWIDGNRGP